MIKIRFNKEEILKFLNNNLSKIVFANTLNTSKYILDEHLKYYNIKYSRKIRPDIDKQWLIDNWVNTSYSIQELAEREKVPKGILEDRYCRYGLSKKFKYAVNTQKLFNLQDPQIWYIAGLIATDGYLANYPDSFELTLTGEDEYQLLSNIKNYLESTAPIGNFNGANRLKICADGIREFLNKNFSIPKDNKTFDVGAPENIPNEECAKAYILGCLDGDGCINVKHKRISITNSAIKFILGFKDILYKYTNIELNFNCEHRKKTNNTYPCASICGKKAVFILDWVYSTNCKFYLNRKYKKYLRLKDDDIV